VRKEIISTDRAPRSKNSQAVKVGHLLYTGGQLGRNPKTGKYVGSDITSQARQAIENLKVVLAAAGTSLENVVKVTVFVRDLEDMPAFNEVYYEYFTANPPARTGVQVAGLAAGALCEFDAVAVIPE